MLRTAFALAFALSACGKVSNLSDEAGLADAAYVSVSFAGKPLLAAVPAVPFKEILETTGGVLPLKFALSKGTLPQGLTLDDATGIITGSVGDGEVNKEFSFDATVTDGNNVTATRAFTLKVNPYTITVIPETLPVIVPRLAYSTKISTIGGIEPLTFAMTGALPAGIALDTKTGVLASTGPFTGDTSADGVPLTVSVTDKNGIKATRDYKISVAASSYAPIQFSDDPLGQAVLNQPYKEILPVTGGLPPFSFKILKGDLPEGLQLDAATGILTGTVPPAAATAKQASFQVEVQDSYGAKDQRTFLLTLSPYAVAVAPTEAPAVIPTIPYSLKFDALGATAPVKFALSGSLPERLRFTDTGVLASVPPHVGLGDASTTWPVQVTATDANGVVSSLSLTITVDKAPANASPLSIQTPTLAAMTAGTAYSSGVTVTGGVAPLKYSIASGALPPGVSLGEGTGAITGNLGFNAAGQTYAIILQVADANGFIATKTYAGVVAAGSSTLTIQSQNISTPIAGGQYSSVIAVTGGLQPYSFSVTSGALPTGLTLGGASGAISGTVSTTLANAPFLFTIAVADSAGQTTSKSYSGTIGTVSSPLSIATTALSNPIGGTNYSSGVSVTGGVAPLTFALQSGLLPTGLTLDPATGVIAGNVPFSAAGATFAVVISVTDAAHQSASRTYTGAVQSGASTLAITTSTLPSATAGSPFAGIVGVSGGATPYAFTITTGALPAGLTLDANAGTITGTPTYASAATVFNFTVKVTDGTNQNATKTYSGIIGNVSAPISIQTTSLPNPVAGTSFSAGLSVTGGVPPLSYSLASGNLPTGLTLDATTGVISGALAYNTAGNAFAVSIRVTDSVNQTATKTYTGNVQSGASSLAIATTSLPAPVAGSTYSGGIAVTGGVTPYNFALATGTWPAGISLDAATGQVYGTPTYASSGTTYNVSVTVTDATNQTATRSFSGTVASVSSPVNIQTAALPNAYAGAAYSAGVSATGGVPPYAFSIATGALPSGLSLNASSGTITGNLTYAQSGTAYAFSVKVTDSVNQNATKTFTGTVQSGVTSLAITTSSLPVPTAGSAYSAAIGVTGGVTPYTFTLTTGTLPSGLSLDTTTGLITGTAAYAAAGATYNLLITVTDGSSQSTTRTYSGTVANVSAPITIGTSSLPAPTGGAAYSAGLAVTGGVAPFTYTLTSGSLASGLSLDASSGVISGTVAYAAAGSSFAFTLKVTDSVNQTASKTFTGTVQSGASTLSIVTATIPVPTAGAGYAGVIGATGGISPYTFAITTGTLPSGLSLDSASGVISGSTAYGAAGASYNVTVRVTDAISQTASRTFSGTVGNVSAPITISTATLPNPVAGGAYSAGVSASGGVPPLTFSLQSGALAAGLSLDASTGVISGSLSYASAGASYAFVMKVTDSVAQTATKTFTGTVQSGAPALGVSTSTLPSPTAGAVYGGQVAVTGGVTPYAFTITVGALPSGLTLDATTGTISGTPAYATAGANFGFTVQVADSSGQSASKAFSGTVGNVSPALIIQTTTLPNPVAGGSYSAGVSATGGVAPVTFAISSGSLPSGLSLDTAKGLITGSLAYSTAGTSFAVSVRATDAAGFTATKAFTGTVQTGASTLNIVSTTVPSPTAGSGYAGLLSVTGGITPYSFSITAGALPTGLSLSATTGAITGTPAYGTAGTAFSFTVAVSDGSSQTATQAYSGTVGNVSPALAIQTTTLVTPVAGAAYSAGLSVTGGVNPLAFSVQSGALPSGLSLNTSTGVISGNVPYSAVGVGFVFVIRVTDAAGQAATRTYSDTIGNGATTLTIGAGALATPSSGASYAAIVPITGGVTPYTFSVSAGSLPTSLSLNTTTGAITGTPAWSAAGAGFVFTITVTDSSSQTASKTYSGTVGSSAATLALTPSSLPALTAGTGYLTNLTATGGVPAFTYAVTAGALPAGITLDGSTGQLSGTPTLASRTASYAATVTVTDSVGHTASQTYSGSIGDYSIALAPAGLTAATPGQAYTSTLTPVGGAASYTFTITAGGLPSGLTLGASSGIISGIVANAEAGLTKNFTVRVVDGNGAASSQAFSLATASFVVAVSTSSLANAVESQAYTNSATALAATGGTTPYTYTYTGTLPTGVGLSNAGSFFGTPTSGSGALGGGTDYPITVRATDAAGRVSNAVSLTLTVTISAPAVTAGSLPDAVLGSSYAASLVASGGRSPYSFALSTGSLPTGLSLSSAGAITGVPTSATACPASQFSITVTDALSQASTAAIRCIATVNGISITNTSFPVVTIGANFSSTVTVVGGTTPYTYAATNLPAGISLDSSTGAISGFTNASVGDYTAYLTATDAASPALSTTRAFTFRVKNALAVTAATLANAGTGKAYSQTIAATGGVSPYTFAIASGSLPSGLSLSSAGVLSGTPAYATAVLSGSGPTYSFSVTATDAAGQTASRSFSLTAAVSATITNTSLGVAGVNVPFAVDLVRVGGANPFGQSTFAWSASGLPSWASINSASGRISGTPLATTGSPFTVAVTVTDSYGFATTKNLTLKVVASGKTMDLKSAHFSEPCLANNTNCDPRAFAVGKLTGTTQQFVVYSRNDNRTLQIAKVDATGRIPIANANVTSININTSATLTGTISSIQLADVDQDSKLDIIFADTGTKKVYVLWNAGTIDTAGMPSGFSTASMDSWAIPTGGDAANFPYKIVVATNLRPDATNYNKTDLIVTDSQSGGAGNSVAIMLNNCAVNGACTGGAARTGIFPTINVVTPAIVAAASAKMTYLYNVGVGYLDTAAPAPPTTYATSASKCPSIVAAGFQQNATGNGYLYVLRQTYSSSVCQGDFSAHGANDESLIATGTPWQDSLAVTDFNNDNISDIAVAMGTPQTGSASVKVYLMPGAATFSGATILTPPLQTLNGVTVGASKVVPYCANGAASCTYPSLLVTCNREQVAGNNTNYGCLSILPNQCSTGGCLTAFENNTSQYRIDYPAPTGQNTEPVPVPVVSTSNLTLVGNTTSGNATISGISSTSGASVGQPVTGTGIPANAVISSMTGTSLTLSQNATATGTGVSFATPVVATLNDVVMMATDGTATSPYFLVYARNGSSTTDPLKSSQMLNAFPASFLEAGEIGTMKIADMNNDSTPDLIAHLVNQAAVSTYMSSAGTPNYLLSATPSYYLGNTPQLSNGCPSGATNCLPDPVFNTIGAQHGYTVASWHSQNTMDAMDINNDGIVDTVAVGYQSRGIAVALGTTSGVLGASILYDVGTSGDIHPQAVTFADLDQDGIPDVLVASINTTGTQTAYVSWLRGNGDGTFQAAQQIAGITSTCTDPRGIAAVDLDGDSRPEIATLCYTTQGLWIARRNSAGTWVAQTGGTLNASGGSNGTVMRWGRLTSTSGMDLVIGGLDTASTLRIISGVSVTVTNATTGAFNVGGTLGTYKQMYGYISDADIGDLDADGYGDILFGMQSQNLSGAQLGDIFYTCRSTAVGVCAAQGYGMEGYQTSGVALGDLNGDGLPDAMVGYRSNAVSVHRLIYRTISRVMNTSY